MRIDKTKLEMARARLILTKRQEVSWTDFASMCGVTLHTISNIRNGRSGGSGETVVAIINALQKQGLDVAFADLLSD